MPSRQSTVPSAVNLPLAIQHARGSMIFAAIIADTKLMRLDSHAGYVHKTALVGRTTLHSICAIGIELIRSQAPVPRADRVHTSLVLNIEIRTTSHFCRCRLPSPKTTYAIYAMSTTIRRFLAKSQAAIESMAKVIFERWTLSNTRRSRTLFATPQHHRDHQVLLRACRFNLVFSIPPYLQTTPHLLMTLWICCK